MSHHFQIHAGYTWSHTISSTEDFFGVSEPADPLNIRAERADAQADIRHAANIGFVIDTEKLSGIRGLRWLFNDWQFGVAAQLQSGRPYPISTGDIPFGDSTFFGIGNETFQRPSVLADGTLVSTGIAGAFATNYLLGPGAVAACIGAGHPAASCTAMQNTFLAPASASPLGAEDAYTGDVVDFLVPSGNLKRNAGRTDAFYRWDLSVTRSFRIPLRESTRVELRADFFNLFNRANFILNNGNPNLDLLALPSLTAANFFNCVACINPGTGQYIGANGQVLHLSDLQSGKVSQFLGAPVFGGLGDPTDTDIPRQIQLSIRVRF
jgi:hypothetical protein